MSGTKSNIEINFGPIAELFDKTLPDPVMLDYYNRIFRREFVLNCEVDENCVELAKQIIDWNREDKDKPIEERTPIIIYINSGGGTVSDAYALIDAMILSKTPVITVGLGVIYSAASMIFIAGHKRYCLPHATYMIHDGFSSQMNTTAKMLDDLEFTKKNEEKTKEYYVSRTTISPELYDQKYRVDWYMDADEMLKYHIVDKVVTDLSEV